MHAKFIEEHPELFLTGLDPRQQSQTTVHSRFNPCVALRGDSPWLRTGTIDVEPMPKMIIISASLIVDKPFLEVKRIDESLRCMQREGFRVLLVTKANDTAECVLAPYETEQLFNQWSKLRGVKLPECEIKLAACNKHDLAADEVYLVNETMNATKLWRILNLAYTLNPPIQALVDTRYPWVDFLTTASFSAAQFISFLKLFPDQAGKIFSIEMSGKIPKNLFSPAYLETIRILIKDNLQLSEALTQASNNPDMIINFYQLLFVLLKLNIDENFSLAESLIDQKSNLISPQRKSTKGDKRGSQKQADLNSKLTLIDDVYPGPAGKCLTKFPKYITTAAQLKMAIEYHRKGDESTFKGRVNTLFESSSVTFKRYKEMQDFLEDLPAACQKILEQSNYFKEENYKLKGLTLGDMVYYVNRFPDLGWKIIKIFSLAISIKLENTDDMGSIRRSLEGHDCVEIIKDINYISELAFIVMAASQDVANQIIESLLELNLALPALIYQCGGLSDHLLFVLKAVPIHAVRLLKSVLSGLNMNPSGLSSLIEAVPQQAENLLCKHGLWALFDEHVQSIATRSLLTPAEKKEIVDKCSRDCLKIVSAIKDNHPLVKFFLSQKSVASSIQSCDFEAVFPFISVDSKTFILKHFATDCERLVAIINYYFTTKNPFTAKEIFDIDALRALIKKSEDLAKIINAYSTFYNSKDFQRMHIDKQLVEFVSFANTQNEDFYALELFSDRDVGMLEELLMSSKLTYPLAEILKKIQKKITFKEKKEMLFTKKERDALGPFFLVLNLDEKLLFNSHVDAWCVLAALNKLAPDYMKCKYGYYYRNYYELGERHFDTHCFLADPNSDRPDHTLVTMVQQDPSFAEAFATPQSEHEGPPSGLTSLCCHSKNVEGGGKVTVYLHSEIGRLVEGKCREIHNIEGLIQAVKTLNSFDVWAEELILSKSEVITDGEALESIIKACPDWAEQLLLIKSHLITNSKMLLTIACLPGVDAEKLLNEKEYLFKSIDDLKAFVDSGVYDLVSKSLSQQICQSVAIPDMFAQVSVVKQDSLLDKLNQLVIECPVLRLILLDSLALLFTKGPTEERTPVIKDGCEKLVVTDEHQLPRTLPKTVRDLLVRFQGGIVAGPNSVIVNGPNLLHLTLNGFYHGAELINLVECHALRRLDIVYCASNAKKPIEVLLCPPRSKKLTELCVTKQKDVVDGLVPDRSDQAIIHIIQVLMDNSPELRVIELSGHDGLPEVRRDIEQKACEIQQQTGQQIVIRSHVTTATPLAKTGFLSASGVAGSGANPAAPGLDSRRVVEIASSPSSPRPHGILAAPGPSRGIRDPDFNTRHDLGEKIELEVVAKPLIQGSTIPPAIAYPRGAIFLLGEDGENKVITAKIFEEYPIPNSPIIVKDAYEFKKKISLKVGVKVTLESLSGNDQLVALRLDDEPLGKEAIEITKDELGFYHLEANKNLEGLLVYIIRAPNASKPLSGVPGELQVHVSTLQAFDSSGVEELILPPNPTFEKKVEAMYEQRKGSCRHRVTIFLYKFYQLKQENREYKNITVRGVYRGEVHVNAEISVDSGVNWFEVDLGGYTANIKYSSEDISFSPLKFILPLLQYSRIKKEAKEPDGTLKQIDKSKKQIFYVQNPGKNFFKYEIIYGLQKYLLVTKIEERALLEELLSRLRSFKTSLEKQGIHKKTFHEFYDRISQTLLLVEEKVQKLLPATPESSSKTASSASPVAERSPSAAPSTLPTAQESRLAKSSITSGSHVFYDGSSSSVLLDRGPIVFTAGRQNPDQPKEGFAEVLRNLCKEPQVDKNTLVVLKQGEQFFPWLLKIYNDCQVAGRQICYFNSPDQLDVSLPRMHFNQEPTDCSIIDPPIGLLVEYLQRCQGSDQSPIIVFNLNGFEPKDFIHFNSLLDIGDRRIGEVKLPTNTQIIGLCSGDHAKSICGDSSLRSRFASGGIIHESSALGIPRHRAPVDQDGANQEKIVINLHGSARWFELLFGRVAVNGKKFEWVPGMLKDSARINKNASIEIINPPDDPKFREVVWRLQLGLPIPLLNNEITFDPIKVSIVKGAVYAEGVNITVTRTDGLKEGMTIITPENFEQLLYLQIVQDDGCMFQEKGLVENNKGQILDLCICENLSESQWSLLLAEAKKHDVPLRLFLTQNVSPLSCFPKAINDTNDSGASTPKCENLFILTDDVDCRVAISREKLKGTVMVVDITELSIDDIFYRIDYKREGDNFTFSKEFSDVWLALDRGDDVILKGQVSYTMCQFFASLMSPTPYVLIEGMKIEFKGRIFLIADSSLVPPRWLPVKTQQISMRDKYQKLGSLGEGEEQETSQSQADAKPYIQLRIQQKQKALGENPLVLKDIAPDDLSVEAARDFEQNRLEEFKYILSFSPWVVIEGAPGAGKSYFFKELERNPRYKIYREHEIEKWATEKLPLYEGQDVIKILVRDEINLSNTDCSQDRDLFFGSIYHKGKYYPLQGKCRVMYAQNPNECGGRRGEPRLFGDVPEVKMTFEPMSKAFIIHKILKSILETTFTKEESTGTTMAILNDFSPETSSIRDLQSKAIFKCVDDNIRQKGENMESKMLAQGDDFVPTEAHNEAYRTLLRLLYARTFKQILANDPRYNYSKYDGAKYNGKNAFFIKGPPGIGKSTFLKAVLRSEGYTEVTLGHSVSEDKIYYHISASTNETRQLEIFHEAFHRGAIVLIDEIDTLERAEEYLNNFLCAEDQKGNRPSKPGFSVLGTFNGAHLNGRKKLTEPFQDRSVIIEWPEYTEEQLFKILVSKFCEDKAPETLREDIKYIVQEFVKQQKAPQGEMPPTFRELESYVGRLVCQIAVARGAVAVPPSPS